MEQKYDYKVEEQVRISAKIYSIHQNASQWQMCVFCEFATEFENRISRVFNFAESSNLTKMLEID